MEESLEMKYNHLNPETNEIIGKSLGDKLTWVANNHFVYYPKATLIIDYLDRIYNEMIRRKGDFPSDVRGLTIVGDSGTGKTSIIQEFIKLHNETTDPLNPFNHKIGVAVLESGITGLRGLYSSILQAFGSEFGSMELIRRRRIRVQNLEVFLLDYLRRGRLKMLFIDEFQHASRLRERTDVIDQLKRTMLVSQVAFIPVGIQQGVKDVVEQDRQLARRCPIKPFSQLDYWTYNDDFRIFLQEYEKFLPFPESSNLGSKDLSQAIFDKVRYEHPTQKVDCTALAELTYFIKDIAARTLEAGEDYITADIIRRTVA